MEYKKEEIRERYKDLFNYSLDFIYINDLKGRFLDANEITLEKLGYSYGEISKLSFIDLIDEKQLRKAFKYTKQIKDSGKQSKRSQYKIKTKSGDFLYIETYGIPLKKDGEIYAILGIGTDITERKRAQQQLKESEERYRILFQESPYSIVILNSEGIILDANPSIEGLIGYKKEDLINKHFSDVGTIYPEKLAQLDSVFKKTMNKEDVNRIDVELRRKDGTRVWTNMQGSIIEIDNKPYMLLMLHDISKRKEAELIISDELEKLKELNDTRKNLIIRVSHELKTPLLLISGGIEYFFKIVEDKINPDAMEVLKSIERASDRLQGLVENLLDATRIDYNKFILKRKDRNLSKIIEDCVNELNYLIEKRHLNLSLSLPDELISKVDELRIQQVMNNLLLNAIKNTPPNGKIRISLQKQGEWAQLEVEDTGIGITQEEKDKLFTRFGKIERQGKDFENINIQGSGLGLFLSKAIINMHGGEIWAESEGRNKGSSFIIKLPIHN